MNKIFINLIITLFCISFVNIEAQERFKPELYIGASTGFTSSRVDFYPYIEQTSIKSIYGGLMAKYISEKYLGIIAEANFVTKGWKEKFDDTQLSYQRKLNYVDVPILAHIYFGEKIKFFFNIGPQISFLISQSYSISDSLVKRVDDINKQNIFNPDKSRIKIGQEYGKLNNYIDYGVVAGAGIDLDSPLGRFSIEGRYYLGLADLFSNTSSYQFQRSANRVISLKISYYHKL